MKTVLSFHPQSALSFCTCWGFPPRCDSVAADFVRACATERRTEGRHCTGVEEGAPPGSGEAPSQGPHDIVAVKGDCLDNAGALGFGCLCSVGAQAEARGLGWQGELSSGRFCMFGGSRFLPRGGSSAQTCCRLDV